MKKVSFLALLIYFFIFFILLIPKNKNNYFYHATFWAYCSNEISNFDKYYHLVPNDSWIILKEHGRITIRSSLKNINVETIKNKRNEVNILSKKILNFVNSQKDKVVDYEKCTLYKFNNKDIVFKEPALYLETEEIINNKKKNRVRFLIFIINLIFTIFFIFKFSKINFTKLYR